MARLLRDKQPRLYDWLFQLRNKRKADAQLDLVGRKPVLHTSRMYPAECGCTTLVMPMLRETGNQNSVLVYDLRIDPQPFLELDQQALQERLFSRADELPAHVQRLPVKSVKINRCPALAPAATLDEASVKRIAIDTEACNRHWQLLHQQEVFMQRVAAAYSSREFAPADDVDLALYDGFFSDRDRAGMEKIRTMNAQGLASTHMDFQDPRLPELLFRYRARNWPDSLNEQEAQRWQNFCQHRLHDQEAGGSITIDEYIDKINMLCDQHQGDAEAMKILAELQAWVAGSV